MCFLANKHAFISKFGHIKSSMFRDSERGEKNRRLRGVRRKGYREESRTTP